MQGKIIDGKKIAEKVLTQVRKEVLELKEKGIVPKLVVIQIGNNPASTSYVEKKHKKCAELGIASEIKRFPETFSEQELFSEIEKLNFDSTVHGILVQVPLPKHISEKKVLEKISVQKDVDGFTPISQGKNLLGIDGLKPATPKGVMTILSEIGAKLEGKNAVVIGRSNIVGKPIAIMLVNSGCTVTICNSKTKNLSNHLKQADLIVSTVGKPKLVKEKMVKKGAIVIDIGTTKNAKGKLEGDVDFEKVWKKCSFITPVPGGVGPLTIASLMQNTLKACREIENA